VLRVGADRLVSPNTPPVSLSRKLPEQLHGRKRPSETTFRQSEGVWLISGWRSRAT